MTITSTPGFRAAGVCSGIKEKAGALDLALIATTDGQAVVAAATFTQNKACAAPVITSRAHLAATGGRVAAIILNSGNANAATGPSGLAVSELACALVAEGIGCSPEEVLVCSTGLIGIPLAADPFHQGVPLAVEALSEDGGVKAANAILTTDTVAKVVDITGPSFRIGGMAKGAAMLAPNMATMLAVLTTDAELDAASLQAALQNAVDGSFNRLSVDGCTSTNDTVIVLASGAAGPPDSSAFTEALTQACFSLAHQMADDAEGATHTVRVDVTGAASDQEAAAAARKVAESQLVKCSWYGNDPYWGRILSEIGTAGVDVDMGTVTIAYDGVVVCRGGEAAAHDEQQVAAHMKGRALRIACDLGVGPGSWWVLTNDLTHAYIDENRGTS